MPTNKLENPWPKLPKTSFILPDDQEQIDKFNKDIAKDRKDYIIQLEHPPEPFQGNRNAAVVLLNLNPGFSDDAPHPDEYFTDVIRCNLRHEVSRQENGCFHFYHLNERFRRVKNQHSPPGYGGYKYWSQHLKNLIETFSYDRVANGLLCVEFFPYPSRKFHPQLAKLNLNSQKYGFQLVREAIARYSIIVITRGEKYWSDSVSELKGYSELAVTKCRRPWITEANLKWKDGDDNKLKPRRPGPFETMIETLKKQNQLQMKKIVTGTTTGCDQED